MDDQGLKIFRKFVGTILSINRYRKPAGYPCQSLQATAASTPEELTSYHEWWKTDSKARTIIERRITPVILSLLPQGVEVTAQTVWETLKGLYSQRDVMLQFKLRDRLVNAKLKDHHDLDHYLGEFKVRRLRLLKMGL